MSVVGLPHTSRRSRMERQHNPARNRIKRNGLYDGQTDDTAQNVSVLPQVLCAALI